MIKLNKYPVQLVLLLFIVSVLGWLWSRWRVQGPSFWGPGQITHTLYSSVCSFIKRGWLQELLQRVECVAAAAKSLQLCPTPCDPIDGSPPGSPVPGIHQARTQEWVAISFSNAWKWKVKVKSLSRVWFSASPWTAAHQAPPSMGFSRQEYWSGVPLPSLVECVNVTKIFTSLLTTPVIMMDYKTQSET